MVSGDYLILKNFSGGTITPCP